MVARFVHIEEVIGPTPIVPITIMLESSPKQNIIFLMLGWLYFDVPRNILKAWRNFLLYNLEYFSIPLLFKTLFSHWRRYGYSYPRGFDIKGYLEIFASNLISRILGAIMRTILIIIGIFVELLIVAGGFLVFLGWLILPLLTLYGIWWAQNKVLF